MKLNEWPQTKARLTMNCSRCGKPEAKWAERHEWIGMVCTCPEGFDIDEPDCFTISPELRKLLDENLTAARQE